MLSHRQGFSKCTTTRQAHTLEGVMALWLVAMAGPVLVLALGGGIALVLVMVLRRPRPALRSGGISLAAGTRPGRGTGPESMGVGGVPPMNDSVGAEGKPVFLPDPQGHAGRNGGSTHLLSELPTRGIRRLRKLLEEFLPKRLAPILCTRRCESRTNRCRYVLRKSKGPPGRAGGPPRRHSGRPGGSQ